VRALLRSHQWQARDPAAQEPSSLSRHDHISKTHAEGGRLMPQSLLVPMHLEAKVLTAAVNVPRLDGDPFNEEDMLEKGIHLHWALPDALTRARFLQTSSGKQTLFPGVPDLWLVVRFNPPPASRATV